MGDVNIKNLPETPEINFGDFLILETIYGTQVIKYDNFVITEQNTTFEPLLSSHSDDIALNTARFGSLSSNFYTLSSYFENQARVKSSGGDYIYSLSALGLGTSEVHLREIYMFLIQMDEYELKLLLVTILDLR